MKKQLAFVLGGGGARGAMQVGALRALLEAGYQPDLLVGTSAGAINAAFLALRGVNLQCIDELEQSWRDAVKANLFPPNYLWLTVRSLFRRPDFYTSHALREFVLAHGVEAHLTFGDLPHARLLLVAADLICGCPALYGLDPSDSVLEGVMASTALPPWVAPIQKGDKLLMDGGVVSNVPIEPAMAAGATEIIALDVTDPFNQGTVVQGFGPFLTRLLATVDHRQLDLELALAAERRIPVRHIHLKSDLPAPMWDFSRTEYLLQFGYVQTQEMIQSWQVERPSGLRAWLSKLTKKA